MRVLTVDDNPIIRAGLRAILEDAAGVEEVLETDDPDRAVALARQVDVVLLDVQMPRRSGLQLLPEVVAHAPVIMLTHRDDEETLGQALAAGASGYLVHGALDQQAMLDAITVCLRGSTVVAGAALPWPARSPEPAPAVPTPDARRRAMEVAGLSDREVSVMEAMAEGLANAEIAAQLYLAPKTVKNNVNRIFTKLAVTTRVQAILRWQELTGDAPRPEGP